MSAVRSTWQARAAASVGSAVAFGMLWFAASDAHLPALRTSPALSATPAASPAPAAPDPLRKGLLWATRVAAPCEPSALRDLVTAPRSSRGLTRADALLLLARCRAKLANDLEASEIRL